MKSFFSLFSDSASELKKVTTITVTGMLMALSIVLRNLAINISADLRITFAFLGIMAVAMLYGPVVTMIATTGIDVMGYFLDGFKARDYNFGLLVVKLIAAMIYGVILYKKATGKQLITGIVISRVLVVVICQLVLTSSVLYYSYTNRNFPFMSGSEWTAFKIWMTPRLIKNVLMLPIELVMSSIMLPAIRQAYTRVFKTRTA